MIFSSVSISSDVSPPRQQYRYRRHLPTLPLLLIGVLTASPPSECLLSSPSPPLIINGRLSKRQKQQRQPFSLLASPPPQSCSRIIGTALNLLFSDNVFFLPPYGVSPNNNHNHYNNSSSNCGNNQTIDDGNHLLSLLLPKYPTPQQLQSQLRDEFQRNRLSQQLKLMQQQQKKQQQNQFQRALLEERLKLHQKKKRQQELFVIDLEGMEQDKNDIMNLIKSAAANSPSAPDAATSMTMEEMPKENSIHVNDYKSDGNNNVSGRSPPNDDDNNGTVMKIGHEEEEGGDDGDFGYDDDDDNNILSSIHSDDDVVVRLLPPSLDLSTQLKTLHQMVAMGTVPVRRQFSSSRPPPTNLHAFLATTHLPLPPSENASMTSITLAPLAHIATSIFLSGAMIFYAIFAVLDIVMNDTVDEYCSSRACMRKSMSIWRSCWDYLFARRMSSSDEEQQLGQQQQQRGRGLLFRTMEVMQTSLLALFYTFQCVIVRAATRSKFANKCTDAGLSSVRYLIYAARSLNVIRERVASSLRGAGGGTTRVRSVGGGGDTERNNSIMNASIKRGRRKFHLLRLMSSIRKSASRRINHQRSLLIKQQRMRTEREYQEKLQSLNADRLAVERDRKQLDVDRANLLSERVGLLLDWYFTTKKTSDELAAEREELDRERKRKGGKRHWRPRFGYWAGLSGDDSNQLN